MTFGLVVLKFLTRVISIHLKCIIAVLEAEGVKNPYLLGSQPATVYAWLDCMIGLHGWTAYSNIVRAKDPHDGVALTSSVTQVSVCKGQGNHHEG